MSRVGEDDWRTYRDVRLAMLIDAPRAFASTYAESSQRTEAEWAAFTREATLWLAYAGAHPVGSVGLWAAPDLPEGEAYLVGMWVATVARGRGVGEALVEAVLAEARGRGLRRVRLDVADENAPAIALYERTGFVRTGSASAQPWDDSVTEFEMARDL